MDSTKMDTEKDSEPPPILRLPVEIRIEIIRLTLYAAAPTESADIGSIIELNTHLDEHHSAFLDPRKLALACEMTALLEIEYESIALAKDVLAFRTFTQIVLYSDEIAMSDVRRSIRSILIDCRGFDNQMVDTGIKYYMREYERAERVILCFGRVTSDIKLQASVGLKMRPLGTTRRAKR